MAVGASESCSRDILSSGCAWGGYCTIHSFMASREVSLHFSEMSLLLHEYLFGSVLAGLPHLGQYSLPVANTLVRQGI